MPRVGRIRTLISKACGVLFSVAGGMFICMYVLECIYHIREYFQLVNVSFESTGPRIFNPLILLRLHITILEIIPTYISLSLDRKYPRILYVLSSCVLVCMYILMSCMYQYL